jgi:putative flippase GtrA
MISRVKNIKLIQWWAGHWDGFVKKHPMLAQFIVFFMLSNGITVLQLIMMPLFKWLLNMTPLIDVNFQVGQVGRNFDGSKYYIFNYSAGALSGGGGGGLAYFLAVELCLAVAQVVNFFAQRNITFKSKSNVWKAAGWYLVAYISITVIGAALQGLYKAPVYNLFINRWNMGILSL